MSAAFDRCFQALLELEGVWSNDPADLGGKTKYGITEAEWDRYRPGVPVQNITIEDARAYYRTEWWVPLHCDEIPALLAYELFEFSVNAGRAAAVKSLQSAINFLEIGSPLVVDGVFGRITQTAVSVICRTRTGLLALVRALNGEQYIFYKDLTTRRPSMERFAKGWTRRLAELKESGNG